MVDIYQNAYLTISAAGASDSGSRFLTATATATLQPSFLQPIILTYQAEYGDPTTVAIYQHSDASMRNPIHMRPWTFQEHLLSPRLLIFSSLPISEVFWQCRSTISIPKSQTAYGIRSYKDEWQSMHRLLSLPAALSMGMRASPDNSTERETELELAWRSIIEEYSSRKLTHFQDKFLALSGMAVAFRRQIQADYLAGLWSCWLVPHLLWKVVDSACKRLSQLTCPSWSGLSVDGPVELSLYYDEIRCKARGVEVEEYRLDVENETAPFGNIRGAVLKIHRYLPVIIV